MCVALAVVLFELQFAVWGRLPGTKGECRGGTAQTCSQRDDPVHLWDFKHALPSKPAAAAAVSPSEKARADPDAPNTDAELARLISYLRGNIPKSVHVDAADRKDGERTPSPSNDNDNNGNARKTPSPRVCADGASCRKLLLSAEHGREFRHSSSLFTGDSLYVRAE